VILAVSDQEKLRPGSRESLQTLEAVLLAVLQRTIDFLKYSEAKNGALMTFSSAWILALIGFFLNDKSLRYGFRMSICISAGIFLGSSMLAVASFLPRTDLPWFLGGKRSGPHPKNLLYFGDVASMTASEFEDGLRTRYLPEENESVRREYLHDLAVQVSVNSQITVRKLRLFRLGVLLAALATAVMLLPLATYVSENLLFLHRG
jgi:hypothetical protein